MKEQHSNNEKLVTILSIDGGGIRGIIPTTILEFLEFHLQVRLHIFNFGYICAVFFFYFPLVSFLNVMFTTFHQ